MTDELMTLFICGYIAALASGIVIGWAWCIHQIEVKYRLLKNSDELTRLSNDLTYDVKCRNCGKVSEMWFSERGDRKKNEEFQLWAMEHSTFPISRQCNCDNGSMMFHDLVSHSLAL